ncbi:MAG: orotidine 5'-phosphate decarboxylase [uncultured bacterium]|nr:MAG: orotidine 5'-phosphate decarboxylase [uncultured bacterium]
MVVGATYPSQLKEVREIVGDIPILIPGIGAQGGDVLKTVKNAKDSKNQGMIISSSRGIIFVSSGKNFAEAAREKAVETDNQIRNSLNG